METNKLISSLCYFSIFFAGFILPVAVYFIVDDLEVKTHAKRAFLSHLIPLVTIPLFIIPFFIMGAGGGEPDTFFAFGLPIFMFLIIGGVNLAVMIWNVVKGIKVLNV